MDKYTQEYRISTKLNWLGLKEDTKLAGYGMGRVSLGGVGGGVDMTKMQCATFLKN